MVRLWLCFARFSYAVYRKGRLTYPLFLDILHQTFLFEILWKLCYHVGNIFGDIQLIVSPVQWKGICYFSLQLHWNRSEGFGKKRKFVNHCFGLKLCKRLRKFTEGNARRCIIYFCYFQKAYIIRKTLREAQSRCPARKHCAYYENVRSASTKSSLALSIAVIDHHFLIAFCLDMLICFCSYMSCLALMKQCSSLIYPGVSIIAG